MVLVPPSTTMQTAGALRCRLRILLLLPALISVSWTQGAPAGGAFGPRARAYVGEMLLNVSENGFESDNALPFFHFLNNGKAKL